MQPLLWITLGRRKWNVKMAKMNFGLAASIFFAKCDSFWQRYWKCFVTFQRTMLPIFSKISISQFFYIFDTLTLDLLCSSRYLVKSAPCWVRPSLRPGPISARTKTQKLWGTPSAPRVDSGLMTSQWQMQGLNRQTTLRGEAAYPVGKQKGDVPITEQPSRQSTRNS